MTEAPWLIWMNSLIYCILLYAWPSSTVLQHTLYFLLDLALRLESVLSNACQQTDLRLWVSLTHSPFSNCDRSSLIFYFEDNLRLCLVPVDTSSDAISWTRKRNLFHIKNESIFFRDTDTLSSKYPNIIICNTFITVKFNVLDGYILS